MKKTVLHSRHEELGAQLVDFAGWEMPLKYAGVLEEHHAVRENIGLFDVSHMGRVEVRGPDAEAFLDYLSTNIVSSKPDCSATYTVWADESGGSVDDVIVYRIHSEHFFVVINGSNREKDLQHMKRYAEGFDVTIRDHFDDAGILAIQGAKAPELLTKLFPDLEALKFMRFIVQERDGEIFYIARAGYTGAPGYEIYASNHLLPGIWDLLMKEGEQYKIAPAGLGARDTLRLEMGFALYGHELSDDISPTESVARWAVKLSKPKFVGKEAILAKEDHRRTEYGVVLKGPGIAREGYPVFKDGKEIGVVTSGNQSPSLKQAIAIILVEASLKAGDEVTIQVRKRQIKAELVSLPFLKK